MKARASLLVIAAVLFLTLGSARSAHAAVAIPDTPAGGVLKAWLDALDSRDRASLAAYCAKYGSDDCDPGGWLTFVRQTGGVDLVSVEKSERLRIVFLIKDRGTPTTGYGRLELSDGPAPRVVYFSVRAIPPGLTSAQMSIVVDAATRTRVLKAIVAKLDEFYVFPEVAKKMIAALAAHGKKGDYDAITDGEVFATTLTKHLQAVSHDKHLHVGWAPEVLPVDELKPDEQPDAEMRARLEADNCGFEKVERLQSNIGYVKLDFFGPLSVCGATASAAMSFVAHVDAVIFDLRDNHGGDPEMVAYLASYLFDTRTHLNDIYDRKENKTTEMWTKPDVPGKKLSGKPAFVLTSKRTFSGGEDFAYTLKSLKRATVVGETTGGGAHPTLGARLDDHFMIAVPRARSINPTTKTNWEGVGVAPDVAVAAEDALTKATKLVLEAPRSVSLRAVGPADQHRGDILVSNANGTVSALTHDGMATLPKLAQDGRTIGFVVVEWTLYHDQKTISFPKILLYRNGKWFRTILPSKEAELDWGFRDGGRRIAVASAGMHGMSFFQLFDVESGALLDSTNSASVELPAWTHGLASRRASEP